ncbi:C-X-C motif chemokine 9 [Rhynchocyon petersi]
MKKSGVLLLFGIIFLFLIEVKGNVLMRNRRCFCIEINQKNIQAQSLKDLKKFVPSPSCEKVEIIATLKNGDQICLNPDLPAVKKLVKDWEKKTFASERKFDTRRLP